MSTPTVVITASGGVMQEAISDQEINVVFLDFDEEEEFLRQYATPEKARQVNPFDNPLIKKHFKQPG
jgi:hypothetical protein